MPIHDWSRMPAGLFHDFLQSWSVRIKIALNDGLLPKGDSALIARHAENFNRLVTTVGSSIAPPIEHSDEHFYATRANRIVVKRNLGRTIAVIEIVSPGNKDSRSALRDFVEKIIDYLRAGIHVLVIDLFPPTSRDPYGIHKVIWDEIEERDFPLPSGKDRVLASYEAGSAQNWYVEAVGVGDKLPDMPLFLTRGWHVPVPLDATYQAAWQATPEDYRHAIETGVLPNPEGYPEE